MPADYVCRSERKAAGGSYLSRRSVLHRLHGVTSVVDGTDILRSRRSKGRGCRFAISSGSLACALRCGHSIYRCFAFIPLSFGARLLQEPRLSQLRKRSRLHTASARAQVLMSPLGSVPKNRQQAPHIVRRAQVDVQVHGPLLGGACLEAQALLAFGGQPAGGRGHGGRISLCSAGAGRAFGATLLEVRVLGTTHLPDLLGGQLRRLLGSCLQDDFNASGTVHS